MTLADTHILTDGQLGAWVAGALIAGALIGAAIYRLTTSILEGD